MNPHPRFAAAPASNSRPYRPWMYRLARALIFLGFFILLMSSSLSSVDRLGPGLWGLVAALVITFTGLGFSYFSMPAPMKPITDVPMKHYGWFVLFMLIGSFVLRWINWDGPQLVILVVLAVLIGWWASYVPVTRRQMICAQHNQAASEQEPLRDLEQTSDHK